MTEVLRPWIEQIAARMPAETRDLVLRDGDKLAQAGVSTLDELATLAMSEESERDLRITACWMLGRLRRGQRVMPLLAALSSHDVEVRREAASSLGLVGGRRAEAALCKALHGDSDVEARELSAFALRIAGTSRSVVPLLATLTNRSEVVRVRSAAAEALGDLHDRRAVAPLMEMLADPKAEVRYWAATALGTLRARSALPALERLVKDRAKVPKWGTVSEAAKDAIARILNRP